VHFKQYTFPLLLVLFLTFLRPEFNDSSLAGDKAALNVFRRFGKHFIYHLHSFIFLMLYFFSYFASVVYHHVLTGFPIKLA
jgi:hypothetical protein